MTRRADVHRQSRVRAGPSPSRPTAGTTAGAPRPLPRDDVDTRCCGLSVDTGHLAAATARCAAVSGRDDGVTLGFDGDGLGGSNQLLTTGILESGDTVNGDVIGGAVPDGGAASQLRIRATFARGALLGRPALLVLGDAGADNNLRRSVRLGATKPAAVSKAPSLSEAAALAAAASADLATVSKAASISVAEYSTIGGTSKPCASANGSLFAVFSKGWS